MSRASVSIRPLGRQWLAVRTVCPHAAYRVEFQLTAGVTAGAAIDRALLHHHAVGACSCMRALWRRYRTPAAPADLDGLRDRFHGWWDGRTVPQCPSGVAVLDWAAAL